MMTSNALAMVRAFDLFGPETDKWVAPKTERDGYFEPAKGGAFDFPTRFPVSLKIDATVSKDGKGYKTVQEAVNAAPSNLTDKKYLIHIKEGIYEENVRVPLEKKNVVFLGDGIGRTVITGKLAVGPPGVFTYSTATAAVLGDGFMAKDLTFKNTAGVPTTQAVAFRSDGDKSYFENCEFRYSSHLPQTISMASLLFLFPFLFLSTPLVYAAREPAPSPTSQSASTPAVAPSFPPAPPAIQKACSITKYPGVCASSLSNSTAKSSLDIVKSAVSLSLADTIAAQNTVDRILKGAGNNLNLTVHCKNCLEELNNAVFRLQSFTNGFLLWRWNSACLEH